MGNLIQENPSFKSKLVIKEQENDRLRELNQKLTEVNIKQRKLIDELHKTIDRISRKGLKNAYGGTP